jgi:hypothetical protein
MVEYPGMRQYFGVFVGVMLGVVGALLFGQSKPPPAGSVAEEVEEVERLLRGAQREIRELRSDGLRARKRRRSQGAQNILNDIRSGKGASLDDVFGLTKPFLIDMSPLINRIRVKEEKEHFDGVAGRYGRKYDLTDGQQARLREWLDRRAEENATGFVNVLTNPQASLMDLIKAGHDAERNIEGIDGFMESQLRGQALADFKQDRMMERIESVEHESNGRLHRLDNLVELDAEQEDQLFYMMARGSQQYVPAMEIEGMTGSRIPMDTAQRNREIRTVLRPEQIEVFDANRRQRREEAEREMREIGLRLPNNWDELALDDW